MFKKQGAIAIPPSSNIPRPKGREVLVTLPSSAPPRVPLSITSPCPVQNAGTPPLPDQKAGGALVPFPSLKDRIGLPKRIGHLLPPLFSILFKRKVRRKSVSCLLNSRRIGGGGSGEGAEHMFPAPNAP